MVAEVRQHRGERGREDVHARVDQIRRRRRLDEVQDMAELVGLHGPPGDPRAGRAPASRWRRARRGRRPSRAARSASRCRRWWRTRARPGRGSERRRRTSGRRRGPAARLDDGRDAQRQLGATSSHSCSTSARWPQETTASVTPSAASQASWWPMIGVPVPGISTIGLGRSSVYGRSRDPWPPARITACVGNVVHAGHDMRRRPDSGRRAVSRRAHPRGLLGETPVANDGVADRAGEGLRAGGAVVRDGGPAERPGDRHAVLGERGRLLDLALEVGQGDARVLLLELQRAACRAERPGGAGLGAAPTAVSEEAVSIWASEDWPPTGRGRPRGSRTAPGRRAVREREFGRYGGLCGSRSGA